MEHVNTKHMTAPLPHTALSQPTIHMSLYNIDFEASNCPTVTSNILLHISNALLVMQGSFSADNAFAELHKSLQENSLYHHGIRS